MLKVGKTVYGYPPPKAAKATGAGGKVFYRYCPAEKAVSFASGHKIRPPQANSPPELLLPTLPSSPKLFRIISQLSLATCLAVFAAVFYLQFVLTLKPCALCVLQRVPLLLILLCSAAGAAMPLRLNTGWRLAVAGLSAVCALAGLALAGRHLWLQSLPADQVPACGPDPAELFIMLPWLEALQAVIAGDGNCAEVQWTLLGLSIPALAGLAFSALAALWLWLTVRLANKTAAAA